MLHITNGDSAGGTIQATRLGGVVLPWQDVLHEGPVPAGLSLEQLRGIRAAFIADQGWGIYERVLSELVHRDELALAAFEHEEVTLWFEHDLYDQLQLIQVLSLIPGEALDRCTLVQPDRTEYLGQLSADTLRALYEKRRPVTSAQLTIARRAWTAFRSPDPGPILSFLREESAALPSLAPAFLRHCQQFPSLENGVNRTDRQILESLDVRPQQMKTLFIEAHHKREELIFMGDTVFAMYVQKLSQATTPLVAKDTGGPLVAGPQEEFWRTPVQITDAGRAVLKGEEDMVRLNGIDRWLGGVYLTGKEVPWRWDESSKTIRSRE